MRPRRSPLVAAALVLATVTLAACGKRATTPALTGDPVTTTTNTTLAPLATTTTTAPTNATSTTQPGGGPSVPTPSNNAGTGNSTTPATSK